MDEITSIQEVREEKSVQQVKFNKPFDFEGKEYTGLGLNFDALSGRDLINASTETRTLGERSPVLEFSKTYQAVIVAKAAKVPVDLIMALPAKTFSTVTIMAQSFLLE